MQNLELTR